MNRCCKTECDSFVWLMMIFNFTEYLCQSSIKINSWKQVHSVIMRLLTKIVDTKSENMISMSEKTSYSLTKSATTRFMPSSVPSTPIASGWPQPNSNFLLQKSFSSTNVESERGFKPSDRRDPQKNEFLKSLTRRVFKVGSVSAHL